MPTGMVYSIHSLAHVTALLTDARVVHWYKVDDAPTIMAAVSASDFTPEVQHAFGQALLNAASYRPDLPVRQHTLLGVQSSVASCLLSLSIHVHATH